MWLSVKYARGLPLLRDPEPRIVYSFGEHIRGIKKIDAL
jgi:hypothetical protein